LFPVCHEKNIGVLLGGIYNSGILANPHTSAKFNYQDADATLIARARELDELCRRHGTELKAAALQFCMAHPAVTVAVMGARNAAEVADNIAMSERAVPQAFWQELRARKHVDARAPLPGGA
jgi:D-threo-aldose 1-dehydrogenase